MFSFHLSFNVLTNSFDLAGGGLVRRIPFRGSRSRSSGLSLPMTGRLDVAMFIFQSNRPRVSMVFQA